MAHTSGNEPWNIGSVITVDKMENIEDQIDYISQNGDIIINLQDIELDFNGPFSGGKDYYYTIFDLKQISENFATDYAITILKESYDANSNRYNNIGCIKLNEIKEGAPVELHAIAEIKYDSNVRTNISLLINSSGIMYIKCKLYNHNYTNIKFHVPNIILKSIKGLKNFNTYNNQSFSTTEPQ